MEEEAGGLSGTGLTAESRATLCCQKSLYLGAVTDGGMELFTALMLRRYMSLGSFGLL